MSDEPEPQDVWINGMVGHTTLQPRIELMSSTGIRMTWSVAEARKIANDIVTMCSRTEADAMLVRFFMARELPMEAAALLMKEFRDYRAELDGEKVEGKQGPPTWGGEPEPGGPKDGQ
jgi:hypothetical protein